MVIELTPEMEATLSRIAERRQLSIFETLKEILDHTDWYDQQIQEGIDSVERGEVVPHDDVKRWLEERISRQQCRNESAADQR